MEGTPSEANQVTWARLDGYNYEFSTNGEVRNSKTKRIRKPFKTRPGYLQITGITNGTRKLIYIHRAVWEAHKGPIPEGMVVHHVNHERDDNRLANLEMVTPQENSRRMALNKLVNKNRQLVVDIETIRQIRRLGTLGKPRLEIAEQCGVSLRCVKAILTGESWSYMR